MSIYRRFVHIVSEEGTAGEVPTLDAHISLGEDISAQEETTILGA